MSKRSENFKNADSATRQAYYNYTRKNNQQTRFYAANVGITFATSRPMDIMASNRMYQLLNLPNYEPNNVVCITSNFLGPDSTGPPRSYYGYDIVVDTPDLYNFYDGFIPVRDKFKIRKTYWTGTPRTRMNL
jgi:hypothetical protein